MGHFLSMRQNMEKDLFKPGPLYNKRFDIVNQIKSDMKSGDILYRYSDAKGPLGLPFTRMVADITKSEYSHAAVLFIDRGDPFVMEVNDEGTLQYRLLDWIDTCYGTTFSVYRLKDLDKQKEGKLLTQIHIFLDKDPDYNFTFSTPGKFYCTQSVMYIYSQALGIQLDPGYYLKDLMPTWKYFLLKFGNFFFSFLGTSLPFNEKLYFVGNEKRGMMSSEFTELVHKI